MIINPYAVAAPAPSIYFDAASQLGTWTLTEGGLKATSSSTPGTEAGIRLNASFDSTTGTYLEFLIVNSGSGKIGIGIGKDSDSSLTALWWYLSAAGGYGFWVSNGYLYHDSTGGPAGIDTVGNGDVVRLCVLANKLYIGRNSTWYGGSDPSTGIGYKYSDLSGSYWPGIFSYESTGNESARIRLSAAEMAYPIPTGCGTMLP